MRQIRSIARICFAQPLAAKRSGSFLHGGPVLRSAPCLRQPVQGEFAPRLNRSLREHVRRWYTRFETWYTDAGNWNSPPRGVSPTRQFDLESRSGAGPKCSIAPKSRASLAAGPPSESIATDSTMPESAILGAGFKSRPARRPNLKSAARTGLLFGAPGSGMTPRCSPMTHGFATRIRHFRPGSGKRRAVAVNRFAGRSVPVEFAGSLASGGNQARAVGFGLKHQLQ